MTQAEWQRGLAWLGAAQAVDDRLSRAEFGEEEQVGAVDDGQGEDRQPEKSNSRAQ